MSSLLAQGANLEPPISCKKCARLVHAVDSPKTIGQDIPVIVAPLDHCHKTPRTISTNCFSDRHLLSCNSLPVLPGYSKLMMPRIHHNRLGVLAPG